jgi:hypothetical protein
MLGNLERAKVIFLLLNPGLRPGDYFAEQQRGHYWQALRRSTQQSLCDETYPFVFLNPAFSWHSGFIWWSRKLAVLIERQIALTKTRSPREAYSTLAKSVANIELFPYHSRKFKLPRRLRNNLPSAKLARQYVHEVLVPRARMGDLLLVVMRCAKDWGLECGDGICAFSSTEARGAHLSAKSKVGQKVLEHLKLI